MILGIVRQCFKSEFNNYVQPAGARDQTTDPLNDGWSLYLPSHSSQYSESRVYFHCNFTFNVSIAR